ncbi:heme NO-binding domain-containing protein [Phaeobacter marinintestinus]|uniref:heme NO-binding domain-containing protein n=1 Tax=Falsiphaeobacter marinintestinus TaxID=1492905 RepID=UPI0011B4211B|nr:heme NO-binding domain-containing protein [Phaeobacter marinintestinus]
MHGLINKAIQSFVCQTYGVVRWDQVTTAAGLGFSEFEAMLVYDDQHTIDLITALMSEFDRPLPDVLEDMGTFLVSHPQMEPLRRLLRFGGETYVDFLHSLDDLPDRTRLAVSDLHLPAMELVDHSVASYTLICQPGLPGFGFVMMGILRAMADDYGALVMLDHDGVRGATEYISITLIETAFAAGREFDLGARAG